ncbi:MAG: hypothetical protein M3461_04405 [Pseudomonadota bacterium]|nr:hypothetical protein [Pseudomonadota bacterium]
MTQSLPINAEFISALLAEDEVGSVIRSHLYVEVQVSAFLELACCLGFDAKFRGALKRIGKLRNSFAHDLSLSLSQRVVSDLYNGLPKFAQKAIHSSVDILHQMCKAVPQPSKYAQLSPKMQFVLIALTLERVCFAACELVRESKGSDVS